MKETSEFAQLIVFTYNFLQMYKGILLKVLRPTKRKPINNIWTCRDFFLLLGKLVVNWNLISCFFLMKSDDLNTYLSIQTSKKQTHFLRLTFLIWYYFNRKKDALTSFIEDDILKDRKLQKTVTNHNILNKLPQRSLIFWS